MWLINGSYIHPALGGRGMSSRSAGVGLCAQASGDTVRKRLKLKPCDASAGAFGLRASPPFSSPKNNENPHKHCPSFAEASLTRFLLNSAYPLRLWSLWAEPRKDRGPSSGNEGLLGVICLWRRLKNCLHLLERKARAQWGRGEESGRRGRIDAEASDGHRLSPDSSPHLCHNKRSRG